MDAENHRLLLTSSPAYSSFIETTENYTLQNQRKCQVLFVYHVPESRASPSSRVHVPESHVLESHVLESHVSESHLPESHVSKSHVPESHVAESHVSESHVSESHVPESHVPESHVLESQVPSPSPHVAIQLLVTAVRRGKTNELCSIKNTLSVELRRANSYLSLFFVSLLLANLEGHKCCHECLSKQSLE